MASERESVHDGVGAWREQPGLGRSLLIGCVIGAALSFLGIFAGVLALGVELPSAVGLGLFVSFWGGLGFGSMMGGVRWASQPEADPAEGLMIQEAEESEAA